MLTESNSQGVIIVDMSVQVLLGSIGHTRQTSFVIPDSQGAGGKIIALTGSCDGRNGHSLLITWLQKFFTSLWHEAGSEVGAHLQGKLTQRGWDQNYAGLVFVHRGS